MMNQVQCGAPLKKVSDISVLSSPFRAALIVHPALAQADERQHAEDGRARHRQPCALREIARRQLRLARQPVHLRLVHQQVERVEPAQRPVRVGAVQLGLDTLRLELVDALVSARAQLGDRAELDRVGWTGLRSEEHTSELQSLAYLVCRLLLEKKKDKQHSKRI